MLEGGSHAGSQAPLPSQPVFSVSRAAHSILAVRRADLVRSPDLVAGHPGEIVCAPGPVEVLSGPYCLL